VVFTAKGTTAGKAASDIEQAITEQLGFSSRVTVLDAAELAGIVEGNPLLEVADNPSRLLVAVLSRKSDRKLLKPLLDKEWGPDQLALGERAAYMWCHNGLSESKLAEAVGRALGDGVTSRNWATILKLHALATDGK
jgi:uncharacterized protein (DUF1697 family)